METESKVCWFVCVVLFFCAVTFITPQRALAEDKGQELPDQKCQRNNTDKSTTTGQCSSVCKDLVVSTTKDVNSGLRTCKQATKVATGWGLLSVTGTSGVQFLRYDAGGEVQACALNAKADEIQCHHVAIRVVEAK